MSTWKEEQVNIIEDYQKVFNTTPPEIATIAIMSDTDNTGKKALAFLDKLEIRK